MGLAMRESEAGCFSWKSLLVVYRSRAQNKQASQVDIDFIDSEQVCPEPRQLNSDRTSDPKTI